MEQKNVYNKLFCVTDRHLCEGDFLQQIEKVATLHPPGIILREKDLGVVAYKTLAGQVKEICDRYEVPLFVHGHVDVAVEIGCNAVHLPYKTFVEMEQAFPFTQISVSCHSIEEAVTAEQLGATQIVLGTIFETNCKPGKVGDGLDFLKEVCRACAIPVYAIGGIKESNLADILDAGASGGCMMSGYVKMK